MAPYADWIINAWVDRNHTTNDKGYWCCNMGDGRMGDGVDLKETVVTDDAGKVVYYQVHVDRRVYDEESRAPGAPRKTDYDDVIPPEGLDLKIFPDKIALGENLTSTCNPRTSKTCIMPQENMLWLRPNDGRVYCYKPRTPGF